MRWADRASVCAISAMLHNCSLELHSQDGRRGSPSRVTRDATKERTSGRTAGSAPGSTSLRLWGSAPPVLLPGRRRQRGAMVEESPGLLRVYSGFTPGCWLAEL